MALKLNHSNGYQDFSPSIHAPGGLTPGFWQDFSGKYGTLNSSQ
jgi:hypothetical protein